MRNRLETQHPREFSSKTSIQKRMDTYLSSKSCAAHRANEITRRIAEMVARDLRPISIVEGDRFKNLLRFMESGYRAPSHQDLP